MAVAASKYGRTRNSFITVVGTRYDRSGPSCPYPGINLVGRKRTPDEEIFPPKPRSSTSRESDSNMYTDSDRDRRPLLLSTAQLLT